jgi:hypothetical protein
MNKQNDIQLSEHFSLSEFTKSITAERLGIDNKPGYEQVARDLDKRVFMVFVNENICEICEICER